MVPCSAIPGLDSKLTGSWLTKIEARKGEADSESGSVVSDSLQNRNVQGPAQILAIYDETGGQVVSAYNCLQDGRRCTTTALLACV